MSGPLTLVLCGHWHLHLVPMAIILILIIIIIQMQVLHDDDNEEEHHHDDDDVRMLKLSCIM